MDFTSMLPMLMQAMGKGSINNDNLLNIMQKGGNFDIGSLIGLLNKNSNSDSEKQTDNMNMLQTLLPLMLSKNNEKINNASCSLNSENKDLKCDKNNTEYNVEENIASSHLFPSDNEIKSGKTFSVEDADRYYRECMEKFSKDTENNDMEIKTVNANTVNEADINKELFNLIKKRKEVN